MRQGTRLFAGVLAAVVVGVVVLIALTALTVALASALGWLLIGRERARKRTEALYRASEQTALTLQQSLLPTDLPDLPSCELAIRFAPAGAGDLVGPGLERSAEQLLRRPVGRGGTAGRGRVGRRCDRRGALRAAGARSRRTPLDRGLRRGLGFV